MVLTLNSLYTVLFYTFKIELYMKQNLHVLLLRLLWISDSLRLVYIMLVAFDISIVFSRLS